MLIAIINGFRRKILGWDPFTGNYEKRNYIPIITPEEGKYIIKNFKLDYFIKKELKNSINLQRSSGRYLYTLDTIILKKVDLLTLEHEISHSFIYRFVLEAGGNIETIRELRKNLGILEEIAIERALKQNTFEPIVYIISIYYSFLTKLLGRNTIKNFSKIYRQIASINRISEMYTLLPIELFHYNLDKYSFRFSTA